MLVRQPMYQQLNGELRRLLGSGKYQAGDRFPTEREVAERFQVSRVTANKALSNLVSEGILEFRKGLGTYVRGVVLDYDLRDLVSFTGKARAAGKKPSTRVLEFRTVSAAQAPRRLRTLLGEGENGRLHFMERLRLADGRPVILERRWVAAARCPDLTRADAAGSLYAYWTERCGLRIAGAAQTIRAVVLGTADARRLGSSRAAAALQVTAVGHLENGAPLWWERTLYRGDRYAFNSTLGPVQTRRPASGVFVGPDLEEDR